MLNLLSTIFRWLQSLLGIRPERDTATEAEAKKRPAIHVVQRLTKKARTSLEEETPLEWGRFTKSFLIDRWQWLRSHPLTVAFFVILIGAITFSERGEATPWWVKFIETVRVWAVQAWQDYPVSISLAGIVLVLFLFGLGWFRQLDNWLLRLWQWAKSTPQIATPLAVILLILIFYILSNANTWSFTSVEVWSEEDLKAEQIAVQFRGNLNAIGTSPLDALTLSAPSPPAAVTNAKSTLQLLSLDHCPQIMSGPKSFAALGGRSPVSLPRLSRAKAETGTAGQISLGTTLGNFSLPLQGLLRLVFSYTAFNYRELSAQIVPATRSSETGAIRIIVSALDGSRWTVEGPRQNLPQLINYLVHRIALDWKAEQTKQPTDQVDSADLALTLGNQAYAAGDFNAAQAYYRLAEQFRTDSATIEVMLGLTQLQLSTTVTPTEKALRFFNQAINLEPNNADLYPYLACLHQQFGNAELAKQYIDNFNATLGPDSPDAKQERITELDKKPLLGPGRRLSVFIPESEAGFNLYYISDDAAYFALDLPNDDALNSIKLDFQTLTAGEAPRQVFAVEDGAYYLTPDGLVNFFRPGPPSQAIPVINADNLQFTHTSDGELILGGERPEDPDLTYNNTGGIRQIFAGDDLLFLVGWAVVIFAIGVALFRRSMRS